MQIEVIGTGYYAGRILGLTKSDAPNAVGSGSSVNTALQSRTDTVSISSEAYKALETRDQKQTLRSPGNLSAEEKEQVEELKETDRRVRIHEMAHKSVAGQYGGPIVYEYQTGPDGRRYAVGGHVDIDVSAESTPEATLRKARIVQQAATAPSDPSPEDIAVASSAAKLRQEALQEESVEKQDVDPDPVS